MSAPIRWSNPSFDTGLTSDTVVVRILALLLALALPLATANADDQLGRIFYSDAERLALEKRQAAIGSDAVGPLGGAGGGGFRFNGVMRMRGGKSNAWVNGEPIDNQANSQRQLELVGDTLVVTEQDRRTVLQAGETLSDANTPEAAQPAQ